MNGRLRNRTKGRVRSWGLDRSLKEANLFYRRWTIICTPFCYQYWRERKHFEVKLTIQELLQKLQRSSRHQLKSLPILSFACLVASCPISAHFRHILPSVIWPNDSVRSLQEDSPLSASPIFSFPNTFPFPSLPATPVNAIDSEGFHRRISQDRSDREEDDREILPDRPVLELYAGDTVIVEVEQLGIDDDGKKDGGAILDVRGGCVWPKH